MNAELHLPEKPANSPAPSLDAFSEAGRQLGQRIKQLRAFQAKYDAMLYLVEFMISFQPANTKDPAQAKAMADLKSLVLEERDKLGLRHTGNH